MSRRFAPLRRISALSVAITLFAAPIAAAQSPDAAPPNTTLLSHAAFVRMIHPPAADVAPARVPKDPPRLDLRHYGMAATARQAQAPAPEPQQRSWAARHKVATGILIGLGVVLGGLIVAVHNSGCAQDYSCLD